MTTRKLARTHTDSDELRMLKSEADRSTAAYERAVADLLHSCNLHNAVLPHDVRVRARAAIGLRKRLGEAATALARHLKSTTT